MPRKLKRYKVHFAKNGNVFRIELDAYTISEARLQFKNTIPYDHIYSVRLMTNKNNHL